MTYHDENPCNICDKECDGCVLERWYRKETCQNDRCFVNNSDYGCMLGLDTRCKASTCYQDDNELV